jgi:hypothetical protein
MGKADFYKDGVNNVICDQCGKKYKSDALFEQWDGIWTCRKCWDYRNPQEYLKGVVDNTAPQLSRPQAPNTFTEGAEALPLPPPTPPASNT